MKSASFAPRVFAWFFFSTFWAMALNTEPASAHRPSATPDTAPTLAEILAGDAEVKRTANSGMPSIMGPFPDT